MPDNAIAEIVNVETGAHVGWILRPDAWVVGRKMLNLDRSVNTELLSISRSSASAFAALAGDLFAVLPILVDGKDPT